MIEASKKKSKWDDPVMRPSKNSLDAATEAAAKVTAKLIALGKLKPNSNEFSLLEKSITSLDVYCHEFVINDLVSSCRNFLTQTSTLDDITRTCGVKILIKGKIISSDEKLLNNLSPDNRPLYLLIRGPTQSNINMAVQKVNTLINSTVNGIPEALRLATISSGLAFVQEKLFVGLEQVDPAFDVKSKILGPNGSYLLHIQMETGSKVLLRGIGSGYMEPTSGREAFEPLNIYLQHPNPIGLQQAKQLAHNLLDTVKNEYDKFKTAQAMMPPTINAGVASMLAGMISYGLVSSISPQASSVIGSPRNQSSSTIVFPPLPPPSLTPLAPEIKPIAITVTSTTQPTITSQGSSLNLNNCQSFNNLNYKLGVPNNLPNLVLDTSIPPPNFIGKIGLGNPPKAPFPFNNCSNGPGYYDHPTNNLNGSMLLPSNYNQILQPDQNWNIQSSGFCNNYGFSTPDSSVSSYSNQKNNSEQVNTDKYSGHGVDKVDKDISTDTINERTHGQKPQKRRFQEHKGHKESKETTFSKSNEKSAKRTGIEEKRRDAEETKKNPTLTISSGQKRVFKEDPVLKNNGINISSTSTNSCVIISSSVNSQITISLNDSKTSMPPPSMPPPSMLPPSMPPPSLGIKSIREKRQSVIKSSVEQKKLKGALKSVAACYGSDDED